MGPISHGGPANLWRPHLRCLGYSGSYDRFMGSNHSLYDEMALWMEKRLNRQMDVWRWPAVPS